MSDEPKAPGVAELEYAHHDLERRVAALERHYHYGLRAEPTGGPVIPDE